MRSPTGYTDLAGLMTRLTGDEKHEAAATSTLDVLWVLSTTASCASTRSIRTTPTATGS